MDDSGVDAIHKLGVVGLHPLRRQASDTNLASADYSSRAGAKAGVPGMQTGGGVAGKSKSPFAIFRRPKSQDPSPTRGVGVQGRDTLPIHITVSPNALVSAFFPRDAISAAYAVMRCPSVSPSVCHVRTFCRNVYLQFFSPSGSQTVLVFPYQTSCVECRWGWQNRDSQTNIWLRRVL